MNWSSFETIEAHIEETTKASELVGYYYPSYEEYRNHESVMIANGWNLSGFKCYSDHCLYAEYEKRYNAKVEFD